MPVEFKARPEILELAGTNRGYKYDYEEIFRAIAGGSVEEIPTYRFLVLNDLFFVVQFVLEIPNANHLFVVDACREVEDGPDDFTLDVWAREHFKSSIVTTGETVQGVLGDPERSTGIFSFNKAVSKKFLFTIRETLANNGRLKAWFPDVLYGSPAAEAPLWSLDDGIIVRRKTNMREPTVYAAGLLEGMPTGLHFDRRVYDDIVTEDIARSPEVMEQVKEKFDSSQNLGKDGGTHRVIGTYYDFNDPLNYIKDKVDPGDLEPDPDKRRRLYHLRLKPATDNGLPTGEPVFLSRSYFNRLKATKTFNCQQLLDPAPVGVRKFEPDMLIEKDPKDIPKNVYKIQLVDPAGDNEGGRKNRKGDAWAMAVVGFEPSMDEIGASNAFILDAVCEPMGEAEGHDEAAKMYLRNGLVQKICVEKVGLSSTELHIGNILKAHGRRVSVESGTIVILRPGGRGKRMRVENNLSWPFRNGKIFISTSVPKAYRDRLRLEMQRWPAWHDDFLDLLAYAYDVLNEIDFSSMIAARNYRDTYDESLRRGAPSELAWMGT